MLVLPSSLSLLRSLQKLTQTPRIPLSLPSLLMKPICVSQEAVVDTETLSLFLLVGVAAMSLSEAVADTQSLSLFPLLMEQLRLSRSCHFSSWLMVQLSQRLSASSFPANLTFIIEICHFTSSYANRWTSVLINPLWHKDYVVSEDKCSMLVNVVMS